MKPSQEMFKSQGAQKVLRLSGFPRCYKDQAISGGGQTLLWCSCLQVTQGTLVMKDSGAVMHPKCQFY